jgi:hypothetical protein
MRKGDSDMSLVFFSPVFDPSCFMPVPGIVMCPVNHTALLVPLVFTIEVHRISDAQRWNPWRQVNIVSDEQCTPACKLNYEALVPTPIVIIRQHPNDLTEALYLLAALPILIKLNSKICTRAVWVATAVGTEVVPTENGNADQECRKQSLHWQQKLMAASQPRIDLVAGCF